MYDFSLAVSSRSGATASGHFDYLRFQRPTSTLDIQGQLMNAYASAFPTVVQMPALEVSNTDDHLNWFGGAIALPDYSPLPILPPPSDPAMTYGFVGTIHCGRRAGVLQPHVRDGGRVALVDRQESPAPERRVEARLEPGVRRRHPGGGLPAIRGDAAGSVPLRLGRVLQERDLHHRHGRERQPRQRVVHAEQQLPHVGVGGRLAQESLLDALAAGRCFFADMVRFRGQLDCWSTASRRWDRSRCPISTSRQLVITATGLPTGGTVKLVKGPVDMAGPGVSSRGRPSSRSR